jgi:hypothetical protein
MKRYATMGWCCLAVAMTSVAGCHIKYAEDGWWDEDGHWDDCGGDYTVSVGAGGATIQDGGEGSPCASSLDCKDGYSCYQTGGYCTAPSPCTTNADCPVGCYCEPSALLCVESSVCASDAECGAGLTCDESLQSCVPGEDPPPACDALKTEAECSERADCTPVYAGVDCTCGAGCECQAGQPGCVCASFEFFRCESGG